MRTWSSKFWEHFAHAMPHMGRDGIELWDEEDGFFYDVWHFSNGEQFRIKIRSLVGIIPLFAVETLESELLEQLPDFKRRFQWFLDNRPDLTSNVSSMKVEGVAQRRLLSVVDAERLRRVLKTMLDEREFVSPDGVRSVSRYHLENPYQLQIDGQVHQVSL